MDELTAVRGDEPVPAAAAKAREYLAAAAGSENTKRAYRADWRDFTGWCEANGRIPLPADPATVALYLADRADQLAHSTLVRRRAAIARLHNEANQPNPCDSHAVRQVLAGIARTHGTTTTQAKAVTVGQVRAVCRALEDSPIGVRDRVIWLVGFAGGLRRSELVGLDHADLEQVEEGITATIRRSKTDQQAAGRTVALPYGSDPATCPVRAIDAWGGTLAAQGFEPTAGPLVRPVDRHGTIAERRLSAAAIALAVERGLRAAGINPDDYTPHSLRAGFVTAARKAGADAAAIQRQTGHSSLSSLAGYIREADLWADSAAARLGL